MWYVLKPICAEWICYVLCAINIGVYDQICVEWGLFFG
jgi:hypothetical protein